MLVEGHYGNNDSLSFDVLQIGLRQHSHRLTAAIFGKDERITAEAHGARLEAISVQADGLMTVFPRALFCKAKAEKQRKWRK